MEMRKVKINRIYVFIATTIGVVAVITYMSFLYVRANYSIGRSGVDARIRVKLKDLSKLSDSQDRLLEEISNINSNSSGIDFKIRIRTGLEECYRVDEMCIEAISVTQYRDKNDIYVLGLRNGILEQVSHLGPSNFLDWVAGK